jgi:hypothetical protein
VRRIACYIATICTFVPLFMLTGITPSYADTHNPVCEKDSPYLCWRDPSDGGPGTSVVVSSYGTDNARLWDRIRDTSRCQNSADPTGGEVTNTPACPFAPGSGLNAKFNGDRIVIVQNYGSGYCAGSEPSVDSNYVSMHSCDGIGGVHEPSTVFVEEPFTDHFRLVSFDWSNGCGGGVLCYTPWYMDVDSNNTNLILYTSPDAHARWTGG